MAFHDCEGDDDDDDNGTDDAYEVHPSGILVILLLVHNTLLYVNILVLSKHFGHR